MAQQMPTLASHQGSGMQCPSFNAGLASRRCASVRLQVPLPSSNLGTRRSSFHLLLQRSTRGEELRDTGTSKARPRAVSTASGIAYKYR